MSLTCTCTLHTPIVSYTVLHSHTLVLTFSPTLTQQSQADTHALILSHILTLHSLALTLTCSLSQCVSHVTHITLTLSLMVLYTHSVSHSFSHSLLYSHSHSLTPSLTPTLCSDTAPRLHVLLTNGWSVMVEGQVLHSEYWPHPVSANCTPMSNKPFFPPESCLSGSQGADCSWRSILSILAPSPGQDHPSGSPL